MKFLGLREVFHAKSSRSDSLVPAWAGGGWESPSLTGRVGMGGVNSSEKTSRKFRSVFRCASPHKSLSKRTGGLVWGCENGRAARAATTVKNTGGGCGRLHSESGGSTACDSTPHRWPHALKATNASVGLCAVQPPEPFACECQPAGAGRSRADFGGKPKAAGGCGFIASPIEHALRIDAQRGETPAVRRLDARHESLAPQRGETPKPCCSLSRENMQDNAACK